MIHQPIARYDQTLRLRHRNDTSGRKDFSQTKTGSLAEDANLKIFLIKKVFIAQLIILPERNEILLYVRLHLTYF